MLYFIPSWYQEDSWSENEQKWYVRRLHTEFDDTVKQIQLFHRSGAYPYKIMLLSFAPNFRHFLHRQGVYHAPYWSVFDAIQEVDTKKAVLFSFHNLNWPENTEFLYNPFSVVARVNGENYARIEFGEDGNPIQIDMFHEGKVCRTNLYDDRGFVSGTIVFENEKPLYKDYLMENGISKMRYYYKDGHVEINSKFPNYLIASDGEKVTKPFSKFVYSNIEEVLQEVLCSYLEFTKEEDIFCVAMHKRHYDLLYKCLQGHKTILSFFGDRFNLDNREEFKERALKAGYLITDSRERSQEIMSLVGQEINRIEDITPYDSRVDFGISQQLDVMKILVPVDGLDDKVFSQLMGVLGKYAVQNDKVMIHLFSRNARYDLEKKLLHETRKALRLYGINPDIADERKKQEYAENLVDDMEVVAVRFFVEQCVDELSVSKCIREQRILVDMRPVPELYLQISAISVAIPQLVKTGTQFVEEGENGFVIKRYQDIPEYLDFFLFSIGNWNDAKVYSYEIGKRFTTKVLLDKWKEVIETVGRD